MSFLSASSCTLVSCPRNTRYFLAIKMGRRQGGPSRTGGRRGAYLNRYVTDEQRSRRPIFIATLWAEASWLFFHVARSTRMTKIWALRSRLEKQPPDLRQNTSYFGDRTLGQNYSPSFRSIGPPESIRRMTRLYRARSLGL